MDEQPIRQHRRLRVRIDLRSDGQGHAIVARVEDRFTNLDVEQVAAARLGNRIGEGSRIIRCAAAGSELQAEAEAVIQTPFRIDE